MTWTCPKCRKPSLIILPGQKYSDTDEKAPLSCTECHGVWIPPAAADQLRHNDAPLPHGPHDDEQHDSADKRGGLCPRGHGMLTRAKVELTPVFYLDRCNACRGVWFDAGEWERTAALPMFTELDRLWD